MSVLPVGFGSALGGFQIERSLRFNSADSAYLNRTFGSTGNQKAWTLSFWVKRRKLGDFFDLFGVNAASPDQKNFRFNSDDTLTFYVQTSAATVVYLQTSQVFRDVSAWYHIVLVIDTANATSADRIRLYANGSRITAFSSTTYPSLNLNIPSYNTAITHYLGSFGPGTSLFDGYMTEVNFIDGQALTPSSFGETDSNTGVWKPKAFSGTYGTNGFYLKFADNSGTTSTTLGKDSSGNGNNWTPNNFSVTAGAGNDSLVDSPTSYGTDTGVGGEVRGNYCTLNPVWKNLYPGVYANGNLDFSTSTAKYGNAFSTIGLTSGKWYVEVLVSGTIGSALKLGVSNQTTLNYLVGTEDDITPTTGVGYGYYLTNGNKATNGTTSAYGNSVASGDIVGIILDLDNGKIWFSKNGTVQASGDPVAGTNAAFTGITASSVWFFGGTTYATQASFVFNFGQRAFAYTAPSGFKALCTQNLPTPTIGATSTTQANDYFNVVLYTGDGANPRTVSGVGFQPDFVWTKSRSSAFDHWLFDAVRGATKTLTANSTSAEITYANSLKSFISDGFTVGDLSDINANGGSYVAWNWKANGAGSSNTAGTITSTVSASTTSGFSIVTYTGNATSGATVGHGLGVAPNLIIVRNRTASAQNWQVYSSVLGATKRLFLDLTDAENTFSGVWNNTAPTSMVFSLGNATDVNGNTNNLVAYCFAPVAGYSAFGSYTGNGSTDGPFVFTNFRPRYVLIKRTDAASAVGWFVWDTARGSSSGGNVVGYQLYPNLSNAESSSSTNLDILSNGFKIRDTYQDLNASGGTYIYACFAESPFKYSLAR